MALHEIVLEETKPETEWVRGRALRKVSPTYRHGLMQRRIATALGAWAEAGAHGRVAIEWRFRVTPRGEITRPLVPDVAYLSFAAMSADAPDEDVEIPQVAPSVAIEVLSPGDQLPDVRDKIRAYIAAGSLAVILLDPGSKSATVHDATETREFRVPGTLSLAALPGFSVELADLFA